MTLLEVMVGLALLSLLMVLLFGYLFPASKAAFRYHIRSQLQQTALVIISKLEQAAGSTSPGGFSWSLSERQALAFNPVDDLQGTNALVRWQPYYEIFWWNEDDSSFRTARWPFAGGPAASTEELTLVRAKRLNGARLREIVESSMPSRSLALGMTHFQITQSGGETALIQPVRIDFTLKEAGRLDRSEAAVHNQSFTLRLDNQQ